MKTTELMDIQAATEDRSYELKSNAQDFQANNIPFLSNIPEIGLTGLMKKAKTIHYLRKEVLGLEGYKANALLIIFSGGARIVRGDGGKHKEIAFQIEEPQLGFGKIALLTDEIRTASVVTMEKTVFAVILKRDFKNWLMNYPDLKFVYCE